MVVWVERKEGEERRAANDGGLYAPLDIAAVKASPALSAQSPALPVDTYHIDSPPKLKNGMKKPPRRGAARLLESQKQTTYNCNSDEKAEKTGNGCRF